MRMLGPVVGLNIEKLSSSATCSIGWPQRAFCTLLQSTLCRKWCFGASTGHCRDPCVSWERAWCGVQSTSPTASGVIHLSLDPPRQVLYTRAHVLGGRLRVRPAVVLTQGGDALMSDGCIARSSIPGGHEAHRVQRREPLAAPTVSCALIVHCGARVRWPEQGRKINV